MSKKSLKALAEAVFSPGQRVGQARGNEPFFAPKAAGQDDAGGAAGELAPLPRPPGIGAVGQRAPVVPLDDLIALVERTFSGSTFVGIRPRGSGRDDV
jgi:hypothetical protein